MFYEEIYQPKVSYCNRDERLPMKLACEFWKREEDINQTMPETVRSTASQAKSHQLTEFRAECSIYAQKYLKACKENQFYATERTRCNPFC